MDLTWCFPQPEPVDVGDRRLFALPLRLADMASLQNYCKLARPCPLERARSAIRASPEGSEARRRLLRDAFLACEKWPARLGSAEGYEILATAQGLEFWLATVLGPPNPELTGEDVAAIAATITVTQYERLVRVAHGVGPLDELARMICPDSHSFLPSKKPTNWGEIVAELVAETGWTFAECGELRLTQLAAIRTRGEAGTGHCSPPPGMPNHEYRRRQKAFFGPDREED